MMKENKNIKIPRTNIIICSLNDCLRNIRICTSCHTDSVHVEYFGDDKS